MKEKEAFQKSLGSSSVISIWKVAQSAEEHLCALGVLWPKEFNDRVGTELSLAAADERTGWAEGPVTHLSGRNGSSFRGYNWLPLLQQWVGWTPTGSNKQDVWLLICLKPL